MQDKKGVEQPLKLEQQQSLAEQKKAQKKTDIFLSGTQLEEQYKNIRELDEFENETKNREIISKLLRPLLNDMDLDRRNTALVDIKINQMNERLVQLEYLSGCTETKPQVFQDIDNSLIELRLLIKERFAEAEAKTLLSFERNKVLVEQMADCELTVNTLQKLMQIREGQIGEMAQRITDIQNTNAKNHSQINSDMAKLKAKVESQLSMMDTKLESCCSQINVFKQQMNVMSTKIEDNLTIMNASRTLINQLSNQKLDISDFNTKLTEYEEQLETIRYAAYDSFRVIKQTDNYIEKYLPFRIQNIVSKNILSFLEGAPQTYIDPQTGKKVQAQEMTEWSEKQLIQYEWHDKFKMKEYELYKDLHRIVLNDDGGPTLKKSAFQMPGYRKVLGNKMDEHEIDNQPVGIKNRQVEKDLNIGLIVPEEIVDSDQSNDSPLRRQETVSGMTQSEFNSTNDVQMKIENQQLIHIQQMLKQSKKRSDSPYLQQQLIKQNLHFVQEEDSGEKSLSDSNKQSNYSLKSSKASSIQDEEKQPKQIKRMQTSDKVTTQNNQNNRFSILTQGKDFQSPDPKVVQSAGVRNYPFKKNQTAQLDRQRSGVITENLDSDIFHARRKQTNYLVGFDDLEPPLADIIQKNSNHVLKLQQEVKQLFKEIIDYKRYMELASSQKDLKFESEVRACLNEQLTYVSELQTEMFKELESTRKDVKEISWQVAKIDNARSEMSHRHISPSRQLNKNPSSMNASKAHTPLKSGQAVALHQLNLESNQLLQSQASVSRQLAVQSNELIVDFLKIQNILNLELYNQTHQNVKDQSQLSADACNAENESQTVIQMIEQIRCKFEALQETMINEVNLISSRVFGSSTQETQAGNPADTLCSNFVSLPVKNYKLKVSSARQQQSHRRITNFYGNGNGSIVISQRQINPLTKTAVEPFKQLNGALFLEVNSTPIKVGQSPSASYLQNSQVNGNNFGQSGQSTLRDRQKINNVLHS